MVNPIDKATDSWVTETLLQIVSEIGPIEKQEDAEVQLILRACSTLLEGGKLE